MILSYDKIYEICEKGHSLCFMELPRKNMKSGRNLIFQMMSF